VETTVISINLFRNFFIKHLQSYEALK